MQQSIHKPIVQPEQIEQTQIETSSMVIHTTKGTKLKEFSPFEQRQVSTDKHQKPRARKNSSGSREHSDISGGSSAVSLQAVQTTSDRSQFTGSIQSNVRRKSRSRSSSKERLLSILANAADAPVTSHEEDDVSGLNTLFYASFIIHFGKHKII